MRELAGYNPDECARVVRWPLREALLCYVHKLKREALEDYRHRYMMWAMLAPHQKDPGKPPRFPAILREEATRKDDHGQ